jgi:dTDP-4-amino-4,6-dideoxygalactose transaminase
MIQVTQPFQPERDKVFDLLSGVLDRNWLTNNGPLLNDYELELKRYLSVDHLLVVGNGTIALQLAIKVLNVLATLVILMPFKKLQIIIT